MLNSIKWLENLKLTINQSDKGVFGGGAVARNNLGEK